MLTTRTHIPGETTVVHNDDGSIDVKFRDQLRREHTSGRSKGMIEHTDIRLQFPDRPSAAKWFITVAEELQ